MFGAGVLVEHVECPGELGVILEDGLEPDSWDVDWGGAGLENAHFSEELRVVRGEVIA